MLTLPGCGTGSVSLIWPMGWRRCFMFSATFCSDLHGKGLCKYSLLFFFFCVARPRNNLLFFCLLCLYSHFLKFLLNSIKTSPHIFICTFLLGSCLVRQTGCQVVVLKWPVRRMLKIVQVPTRPAAFVCSAAAHKTLETGCDL